MKAISSYLSLFLLSVFLVFTYQNCGDVGGGGVGDLWNNSENDFWNGNNNGANHPSNSLQLSSVQYDIQATGGGNHRVTIGGQCAHPGFDSGIVSLTYKNLDTNQSYQPNISVNCSNSFFSIIHDMGSNYNASQRYSFNVRVKGIKFNVPYEGGHLSEYNFVVNSQAVFPPTIEGSPQQFSSFLEGGQNYRQLQLFNTTQHNAVPYHTMIFKIEFRVNNAIPANHMNIAGIFEFIPNQGIDVNPISVASDEVYKMGTYRDSRQDNNNTVTYHRIFQNPGFADFPAPGTFIPQIFVVGETYELFFAFNFASGAYNIKLKNKNSTNIIFNIGGRHLNVSNSNRGKIPAYVRLGTSYLSTPEVNTGYQRFDGFNNVRFNHRVCGYINSTSQVDNRCTSLNYGDL